MANYSLVAGAQFRPFSYQELMAPIARMNEVQGQLEEQYDALSAQADVLEAMGKNDRDKGVYNQYKAFSDALRAEADNLYRNGLTSDSRLRLSDMKRRYSKEIVPILNAWAKRKQEADVQMKAQMADPTLMFTRNANTTSLQNYIDNPEGGFTTISGKNIASQVGTGAAALAEEIRMNPNGEAATRLKHLDPFTYETIVKRGFTSAEIADWQNRPALRSIVENVLAANGVTRDNLGDRFDSIYSQSLGYAVPALNQAVGKTTVGTMDDYYNQKMLDFNLSEQAADNASRRKAVEEGTNVTPDVALKGNPINLYTKDEEYKNSIRDFDKYFNNGQLTTEGLKAYYSKEVYMNGDVYESPFKKFMDDLNGGKPLNPKAGESSVNKANRLFREFVGSRNKYDATKETEYVFTFHGDQEQGALNRLKMSADSNNKVYTQEWDGKKFNTGKTLDVSELEMGAKGNVQGVEGRYGIHGSYLLIRMKDGKTYRVPTKYINGASTQNVIDRMHGASEIQKLIDVEGPYKTITVNGRNTTHLNMLNQSLNNAYDAYGSIFGDATIEPNKVTQGFH